MAQDGVHRLIAKLPVPRNFHDKIPVRENVGNGGNHVNTTYTVSLAGLKGFGAGRFISLSLRWTSGVQPPSNPLGIQLDHHDLRRPDWSSRIRKACLPLQLKGEHECPDLLLWMEGLLPVLWLSCCHLLRAVDYLQPDVFFFLDQQK